MSKCIHMNFKANVSVGRLTDPANENIVKAYTADVRVECAECGLPFQFLGLPMGMDTQGARVSTDGLEARLAISPQGLKPDPLQRMAFGVNKVN